MKFCIFCFLLCISFDAIGGDLKFLDYDNGDAILHLEDFHSQDDVKLLGDLIRYVNRGLYGKAKKVAVRVGDNVFASALLDYVDFNRFVFVDGIAVHNRVDLVAASALMFKYDYVASVSKLRKFVEDYLVRSNASYSDIRKYLGDVDPVTFDCQVYMLDKGLEMIRNNSVEGKDFSLFFKDLIASIKNIWKVSELTSDQMSEFVDRYGYYLDKSAYLFKVRDLIAAGDIDDAYSLFDSVDSDEKLVLQAIYSMKKNAGAAGDTFSKLPKYAKNDGLLLITYMNTTDKDHIDEEVVKVLTNNTDISVPAVLKWQWKEKLQMYARNLISAGRYKEAYKVSSNSSVGRGISLSTIDLRWMAGWIKLEMINQSKDAYKILHTIYLDMKNSNVTVHPRSKTKILYWLGRASEKLARTKEAMYWYEKASQYTTTFYGQVSTMRKIQLSKNNADLTPNMTIGANILFDVNHRLTTNGVKKVLQNKNAILGYMLSAYPSKKNKKDSQATGAKLIKDQIKNSNNTEEIIALVSLSASTNCYEAERLASYEAYKKNIVIAERYFKVPSIVNLNEPHASITLAKMKIESDFVVDAVSKSGALGLMQLMPSTARFVAGLMKIKHNKKRLTLDPIYNMRLGTFYYSKIKKDLYDSDLLAVAAYNGGPTNVKKWINKNGHPKEFTEINDWIQWIELIPIAETREYSKMVTELSIVYDHVIKRVKKSKNRITAKK